MKTARFFCLMVVAATAAWAQAPTITAVENAATNIRPGLPNSPIAQGAMFVVKGSNLGPSSIAIATTFPLAATQAGTSVQVTVGGTTVSGIMYYTLATQIAAVLPSSTPTGTGTLTVTYNGATSAPAPITVVPNNIGVFTIATTGVGNAVATLADNTLVSPTNAPHPGDTVVLWGTGLGPVTYSESVAALGGNMPNVPLQAFIGGQSATILYQGRNACCTSIDTIYVTVPAGVATGCAVSVAMQIGNMVSNATTIPVASSGRTCTPTNPAISQNMMTQLLAQGSPLAVAGLSLTRTISTTVVPGPLGPLLGSTAKSDSGSGRFVKYNAPASVVFDSTAAEVLAYGSCIVTSFSGTTPDPLAELKPQYLDAGPTLAVSGPNGNQTMAKTGTQGAILYTGKFDAVAAYLAAGAYTISGTGGNDVSFFTANLNAPTPINWTNQAKITSVNRSQGVTVNWDPTTGDPNGYVFIVGVSTAGTSTANAIGAGFTCAAPTTAGAFTVPPNVLLALPATVTVSGIPVPGTLAVYGNSSPQLFQAIGLDLAVATDTVIISTSVTYQ
jgi:uncharacterized protein (TIGR03437 family)